MRSRKYLKIEAITTRPNGEIILEGEGVAISIKRVGGFTSVRKTKEFSASEGDHTATVKEVFESLGGLAF